MSTFTPGPWQILPEEMGKNYLRVRGTVLGLRHKIADVRNPDYEGFTEKDANMTRANARLIAAAPELLDSLQTMLSLFDHYGHPENDRVKIARDIVAKATGQ